MMKKSIAGDITKSILRDDIKIEDVIESEFDAESDENNLLLDKLA